MTRLHKEIWVSLYIFTLFLCYVLFCHAGASALISVIFCYFILFGFSRFNHYFIFVQNGEFHSLWTHGTTYNSFLFVVVVSGLFKKKKKLKKAISLLKKNIYEQKTVSIDIDCQKYFTNEWCQFDTGIIILIKHIWYVQKNTFKKCSYVIFWFVLLWCCTYFKCSINNLYTVKHV